jgi:putative DNA primase/helicase
LKDLTSSDLSALLGLSPPETENAAPAGTGSGVETSAALEIALQKHTESAPENQAWAALDAAPQWCAWREERRGDKLTKVPYSTPERMARANDAGTWLTRARADAVAADLLSGGRKGGVGLFLGGEGDLRFGGIDLDSCLGLLGDLEPWAAAVLARFASYAEVSPSGTGAKVFFAYRAADLEPLRAIMGTKWGCNFSRGDHTEIGLFLGHKYFTVTGQRLDSAPATIETVDRAALEWLITDAGPRFKGDAPATASKDASRSGRAFRLAGECRRAGMTFDAFKAELAKVSALTDWAKDARQVKRAWDRTTAHDVTADLAEFDDMDDLPEEIGGFPMTEDGVARAFAAANADKLRFCHSSGRWHVWMGSHWRKEESKLAFDWARKICRARAASDPRSAAAKALAKAATASAVERFAQADRALAVTADTWDRDHWLLGTPGGTVDLRTGELRLARQGDMITKVTAAAPLPLESFDPARDCPRWLAFLDQATGGDAGAIRFLQQWAGYSLTGDTREEALLFVHGPGQSGKSTAINTLGALLGDYAVAVDTETITAQKHARHSTEVARLHGARMAYASETEAGRAWAENRIKQLTGGDVMTARFMRQDDFSFKPQLKLVIVGNNKPAFSNVDGAIKRRFNVMPFNNRPAVPDFGLKAALEAEYPGILTWAVQGCLDWQRHGLVRPAIMVETTADYFESQDIFAQWLADSCIIGPRETATSARLFESWASFALSNGEAPGSKLREFPEKMEQRGFKRIKDEWGLRGRGYLGLSVKSHESDDGFDRIDAEAGSGVRSCLPN